MAKSYSLVFIVLFLLTLGSCQSLEQIPIDYLQPADLSFPRQLRKVAIVNNTSDAPDNKLITETEKIKEGTPLISRATAYANGDPKTATESLAEEIAQQNYFDEVVICDSALRANDKLARESTLSQEEVRQLTSNLGVDFIIALENLQLKATKTVRYLDEFNCFQGAVDVKVYPTVKVYLPERSRPMTTLHPNDSIFWEEFGGTAIEAATRMIPDKQMLEEAAAFAGTVPVKNIVPIWKKGTRYLYTGGSVPMRDAAIYVRENSWDDAYELWRQAFDAGAAACKDAVFFAGALAALLVFPAHGAFFSSLSRPSEPKAKALACASGGVGCGGRVAVIFCAVFRLRQPLCEGTRALWQPHNHGPHHALGLRLREHRLLRRVFQPPACPAPREPHIICQNAPEQSGAFSFSVTL